MAAFKEVLVLRANVSDAEFRAWGKAIHDILVDGDWIQTADTGQIDWDTVTAPATNTYAGYEIWRSNDAGEGLVEFYIKLEYGASPGGVNSPPMLRAQVGWGSNGSGSLTGTLSTLFQLATTFNATTTPQNCYYFAEPGSLALYQQWWFMVFSVERLRDNSGTKTNELLFAVSNHTGSGINRYAQVLSQSRAYVAQQSTSQFHLVPMASNAVQDGKVGIGMIVGQKAGLTNPGVNILSCGSDTSSGRGHLGGSESIIDGISMYGTSRRYLMVDTPNINGSTIFGSGTCVLMRFE